MKKLTALFLSLLLIAGIIPAAGAADGGSIAAAAVSAKPGETVSIPVSVSGNPGFSYLKLTFSYDDTALNFIKAENGAVSTDAFTPTAAALTWDSDNDATANGTLCTLTFTVKDTAKEGAYDIGLRLVQSFNYNEAPVAFTVTGGRITVQKPASAQGTITAAAVSAKPGETVDIPVTVSGNPGFSYLKLAFSYDDTALNFIKVENGAVSTDAFTPTAAALTWDSDNDATANGTLCTLTFTVKDTAKEGAYDIGLRLVQSFNYDEAPVAFAVTGGKINVTPAADDFLPGDVDHDGSVTAADARLALRRAVDLENFASGSYEFRAADIDRSGAVTAADARIILRIAVQLESAEDYR